VHVDHSDHSPSQSRDSDTGARGGSCGGGGGSLSVGRGSGCFIRSTSFFQKSELLASTFGSSGGSSRGLTDLLPATTADITDPNINNNTVAISIVCGDFIQVLRDH
tara:strand:- start:35 stop:352 length:318 start_codon:yes stop_codon:yes gene_type:complete